MMKLYKYAQFLNAVLGLAIVATIIELILAMQFSGNLITSMFVTAAMFLSTVLLVFSSCYIKESLRNLCGQIAILILVFLACVAALVFECFFDIYSLQFIDAKLLSSSSNSIITATLTLLLITVRV